jgi:hypothetical protein
MSQVSVDTIIPQSGTSITIGGSGDTVTLGSGASASGFTSGIVGVSTFTSSGTWTKATREAALGVTIKRVIVEVQGAGGSGSAFGSTYGFGAGGGYVKKLIDVSSVSSSTITVGAGGAGKAANTGAGNAGGSSSWNDGVNAVLTAGGGTGGTTNGDASDGGSATGGDFNVEGQGGGNNGSAILSGKSFLGTTNGSTAAPPSVVMNTNPLGYGAGSGTGSNTFSSADGGSGIVIVTEIAG